MIYNYQYERELQRLKPYDETQGTEIDKATGYNFITTAGHGYLVVPKNDKNAEIAKTLCRCGFIGDLAYYIEEDCEYFDFLNAIKK